MTNDALFSLVDANHERYVSIWTDICNIESPTSHKAGVDAVGKYVADWAIAHGFAVEWCKQEKAGDVVCITMNPDAPAAPIVFSGHMDTVHPLGLFGSPAVRRDGNYLYGPGVTDCKGGIVVAMLAMEALQQGGFTARPIRLLLQSDEETGSRDSNKATIRYICERSADAAAFLNLEGKTADQACVERKGIVTFRFDVTGVAAHAARCATDGANAIVEAAHKMTVLHQWRDVDGITCNCGMVEGGTAPNTVPEHCSFIVNVRFVNQQQCEQMRLKMQEIAATVYVDGCRTTVEEIDFRVAMERNDRNLALLDAMNRLFVTAGFSALEAGKRVGGSDAADVTVCGIPVVDSIGVQGGNIHSKDEYALVSSLARSAKRLVIVATGLGDE